MATVCNVTNIGLLTGSGWRWKKTPIRTGWSKTNTKGNTARAASSSVSFLKMFSLLLSFVLFCEGFCCLLLLLLFTVLVLFVCFTYLSLLPPEVIEWEKWLFLVIEAPSLKKQSPPSFNSSCINKIYFGTSVKNICTLCWTNICFPLRAAGLPDGR